jgi:hypothetical protein
MMLYDSVLMWFACVVLHGAVANVTLAGARCILGHCTRAARYNLRAVLLLPRYAVLTAC